MYNPTHFAFLSIFILTGHRPHYNASTPANHNLKHNICFYIGHCRQGSCWIKWDHWILQHDVIHLWYMESGMASSQAERTNSARCFKTQLILQFQYCIWKWNLGYEEQKHFKQWKEYFKILQAVPNTSSRRSD